MRKMMLGFVAAGVLALQVLTPDGSSANAAELEGVIEKMDTDVGAIILTDGTKIMLPPEFNVDGLEPGKKIYVDYDVVNGVNEAQIIELIED